MYKTFRELAETIITAVLIFVALQITTQSFEVRGRSMSPTIQDGQRLLVNKFVYANVGNGALAESLFFLNGTEGGTRYLFHGAQRGEIVVFHPPGGQTDDFVKRVVAIPGDEIDIREGVVYVNGIESPYDFGFTASGLQDFPMTVPPDKYFVLGDNRRASNDSRAWGFVDASDIVGRAWIIYWPPPQIRVFG